ncbi:MAG: squalene/phytoene synthase family protein [Candidatus Eisenbacteria bacterium]|uniref:Squalene/phytoene synthase family protein n=1 Tax=Eiseniibacteriota bacterium TaxID=2212470 RepID=A0A956NDH5_UNCEI|nr:squalene/phytoene synthase family protein [Candidatus Eisenbacteria bacterium]
MSDRVARVRMDRTRCRELLPMVSRTFALTIRVLPGSLRDTVTVAYLLCRLADVVEDATGLDPDLRVATLETFADALHAPPCEVASGERAAELSLALRPAESLALEEEHARTLLRERETVFRAYCSLEVEERRIVARWVEDMSRGMAGFVARERVGREDAPAYRLETAAELRDYAYYVAGTVGHLLTDLFQHHIGSHRLDGAALRARAVPFGLGLQFTNILQDLAEDRRRGWSYVPEELASKHGTTITGLLRDTDRTQALRVVGDLAREAARNLDQAMEFTLLLPRSAPRIRLFCVWPIFFAMRTLQGICSDERVLVGGEKVKITRGEVRRLIGVTMLACLSDGSLRRLYQTERDRFAACLDSVPV